MTLEIVDERVEIVEIDIGFQPLEGGIAYPHEVLAGPASGAVPEPAVFRFMVPDDIPFAAILDRPNVLTDVNTIKAIRLGIRVITTDSTVLSTDYLLLVNASGGNVIVTLPNALANGHKLRIKKTDASSNSVFIFPAAGDLINADTSITLDTQFGACELGDAEVGRWDAVTVPNPVGVALLAAINVFTQLNVFSGISLGTTTVTEDYTVTDTDFEIAADASMGSFTIFLPQNFANRRWIHIKRVDDSENIVTVQAYVGDNIDGSASVTLIEQYADCMLFGASVAYWDNMGAFGDSSGAMLPSTENLIAGDGLGGGVDSGIDPAEVVLIQDPLPARPTTQNEIVALLVSYGLCS